MRKGLIKISNQLYSEEFWQDVSVLFSEFRPIHIEYRSWENDIWYLWGFSKYFDELEEGENIPEYYATLSTNHEGKTIIEFSRATP